MKLDNRENSGCNSVVAAPLSNPFRGNPSVVLATIVSYITVQNIGIILSYLSNADFPPENVHQTLKEFHRFRFSRGFALLIRCFHNGYRVQDTLLSKDLRIKPTAV